MRRAITLTETLIVVIATVMLRVLLNFRIIPNVMFHAMWKHAIGTMEIVKIEHLDALRQ